MLEIHVQRFDPHGDYGNPVLKMLLTLIADNSNMISTNTTVE